MRKELILQGEHKNMTGTVLLCFIVAWLHVTRDDISKLWWKVWYLVCWSYLIYSPFWNHSLHWGWWSLDYEKHKENQIHFLKFIFYLLKNLNSKMFLWKLKACSKISSNIKMRESRFNKFWMMLGWNRIIYHFCHM